MSDFRKELMTRRSTTAWTLIRTATPKQWAWALPRLLVLVPIFAVYKSLQATGNYLEYVFDVLSEWMGS